MEKYGPARLKDAQPVQRNLDPVLHPFEKAKEYTRALSAAKVERMFAKPFIGALAGHIDGVYCLSKHPWDLTAVISGSGDGEVRIWDLREQQTIWSAHNAHQGMVRGTCPIPNSRRFISVGVDQQIKVWAPDEELESTVGANPSHARQGLSFTDRARLANLRREKAALLDGNEGDDEPDGDDDEATYDYGQLATVSTKRQVHGLVRDWDGTKAGQERHRLKAIEPVAVFQGQDSFTSVDHHRTHQQFATSCSAISVWDINRSEPLHRFEWEADTINTVRFNQAEVNLLASCGSDRSLILYDLRSQTAMNRAVMEMNGNAIAWNPMKAHMFAVANENQNCYVFDMRYLKKAHTIHIGHTSAVMDVDYSPTGLELVTGSYDQTVRIFEDRQRFSRDVYHTQRMQQVFSVRFSMDAKFVISGSDDGNVRIWKARASEKLGPISKAEKDHINYSQKLKDRYKHLPEIRKVLSNRHPPKHVRTAARLKSQMLQQEQRRQASIAASNPHARREQKDFKEQVVLETTFK
ncbi:Protein sof1 [Dimargaris xerosporica]|nr:Protein sof1 [Dimargaris xerosporica]